MANEFTQTADLQVLRYAQVWEDHQILTEGLQVTAEDDVLSICSAGCNALALLLCGPRSVTAIDVSEAQAALLQLKVAAIAALPHEDLLILLGVEPGDALARYAAVRDRLPDAARAYWDRQADTLREGVVHAGRLERYIRGFQREHLLRLHPPEVIEGLLSFDDPAAQLRYFDERVATPSFRAAFCAYFGEENMKSRGRDPAQFRYVSAEDVGAEFFGRLRALCGRAPLRESPYMTYFLTGRFPTGALRAPYLRAENHERLRALLPRLRLVTEDLGGCLARQPIGTYSKANLSDIFEYMSAADAAALLGALGERLRPGGRVAYWNLLVERSSLQGGAPRLRHLGDAGRRLHARDRVFFYQAFHIEEVSTP